MYYDDNYGWYDERDTEPGETAEFYHRTQAASVWKKCSGCNRRVKIKPEYGYCNSCADKRERGYDL